MNSNLLYASNNVFLLNTLLPPRKHYLSLHNFLNSLTFLRQINCPLFSDTSPQQEEGSHLAEQESTWLQQHLSKECYFLNLRFLLNTLLDQEFQCFGFWVT